MTCVLRRSFLAEDGLCGIIAGVSYRFSEREALVAPAGSERDSQ